MSSNTFSFFRFLRKRYLKFILWAATASCGLSNLTAQEKPTPSAPVEDVKHTVVYYEPGKFAGWPANGGLWIWGNEILVCYEVGDYLLRKDHHAFNPDSPMLTAFARSQDGGLTWSVEEHSNVTTPWSIRNDAWVPNDSPKNLSGLDFAMKLRDNAIWFSGDRGKNWQGPSKLDIANLTLLSRTNYIPTGEKSALVFLSAREKKKAGELKKRNRSLVVETTDGGQTFQFLSWLGDESWFADLEDKYDAYSIMPSAVRLDADHYVCAVREARRRNKWVKIFESTDGGKSWSEISKIAQNAHNPAALVSLGGKRIAAIYGNRENGPKGMFACLSEDGGHTWKKEVTLREDAVTWDFGYPVAAVRPDGAVVIVYYMNTADKPNQHIAATIWRPRFYEN